MIGSFRFARTGRVTQPACSVTDLPINDISSRMLPRFTFGGHFVREICARNEVFVRETLDRFLAETTENPLRGRGLQLHGRRSDCGGLWEAGSETPSKSAHCIVSVQCRFDKKPDRSTGSRFVLQARFPTKFRFVRGNKVKNALDAGGDFTEQDGQKRSGLLIPTGMRLR